VIINKLNPRELHLKNFKKAKIKLKPIIKNQLISTNIGKY